MLLQRPGSSPGLGTNYAGMAELADAPGSNLGARKGVWDRGPLPVPTTESEPDRRAGTASKADRTPKGGLGIVTSTLCQ